MFSIIHIHHNSKKYTCQGKKRDFYYSRIILIKYHIDRKSIKVHFRENLKPFKMVQETRHRMAFTISQLAFQVVLILTSTFLSKVLKINWELNFWGNWQSEKKIISGKTEALLFLINPIIVIGAPLCPPAPTWMAGALTASLWSRWTWEYGSKRKEMFSLSDTPFLRQREVT